MTASNIQIVCNVSVQIIVFIPPIKVYDQINRMEMTTVSKKETPIGPKTNAWSTIATRYNLNEAPINLDNKKKEAPTL